MTTVTEKKANANDHKAAPATETKQVAKAVKALEAVTAQDKAVSVDQPKSVKLLPMSNHAKPRGAKPHSETVEEAIGRIKMDLPKKSSTFTPWGAAELKYYSKEELAALKTPWVMVKGVMIEPRQVDIKEAGRITTDSGHTFWLNTRMAWREKDVPRTFSHFVVESDGITVQLLLDEKSSVQINSFDIYRGGYQAMDINRHLVNQAILINTDSTHDTFLGEVILENQSTNSCVFNSSTVSSMPRQEERYKSPWLVQHNREEPRRELKYSSLSRSSVFNSVISDSIQLLDTTIDDSNIKTNEGFAATNSRLKEVTIKGHRARLKFAQLEKTYIPSTGSVLIVNTTMKDESLGDKSLYIPNKFCTLKVDLPHDHLSMRRETVTKVGITIGYRVPVDLEIDAPMDVIDAKVREVLRDSSYHNPLDPDMKDPVVANLIHYVVQSIRSRLRVIKMLDSAIRTARVVTGEAYREDNGDVDYPYYPRPF